MSETVKRDVKNTVFIDLFAQDEYRLQLFQTLHPEMTDVTADELQIITLKPVITNHQYNDLAFMVRDKLMVFVEAQSTWSVNILIRILLYLADTIQEYLHDRQMDIHAEKQLPIPKPEFYVIYTGERKVPEKISLKKDFFRSDLCPIDLEARVFNLETEDIIGQYIVFCHVMDEQIRKYDRTKEAAVEAIRICRDRDALKDYLNEREKEVVDIMIALFDQEYAVKQYGNTMKQEGIKQGEKQGVEKGESLLGSLMTKLKEVGRTDDAFRAAEDPAFRQKLYKEFKLA